MCFSANLNLGVAKSAVPDPDSTTTATDLSKRLTSQLEAKWMIFSAGTMEAPKNVLSEMDKTVLEALGYLQ